MDRLISDVIGALAVILAVSALFAAVARRCGQPVVIGQILAGLVLGPSVLGRLPGHLVGRLFPTASVPALDVLAQIAVALFMFVIGYELDLRALRGHRRVPVYVACGALLVPMTLGCAATIAFRSSFTAVGLSRFDVETVLYMGIALSVTALPVLAAIVRERGIAGTLAGVTATSAAGLMDVVSWLVLAGVIASAVHGTGRPWTATLGLLVAFVAGMRFLIRPLLGRWMTRRQATLANKLPTAAVLCLGGAWFTASIGLHPVFGALVAGLTMPKQDGTPDPDVLRPLEQVGGLLLPLFFVVTGLSLNVGAMNATAFLLLALVCVIAVGGKIGPAYAASRAGGLRREDAATVAALVNTRGLTELIALNLGLSSGLIGPRLFAVLVLMALITTMMTAPLLTLIGRHRFRAAEGIELPRRQRLQAPSAELRP
ncbi:MAG TPA: cation:proton antiporter [Actinospica sp.]|nr:cation:proton antiporter [Actinospica sp.]